MKLSQYQSHWDEVLTGKIPTDLLSKTLELPSERLQLYRGFIANHYREAIEKMYPRLREYFPSAPWNEITESYYRAFPPVAWEINGLSQNFPEFLRTSHREFQLPQWASELAAYEWVEFAVYTHLGEEAHTLNEIPAGHYTLNPTLEILALTALIGPYVASRDRGESTPADPSPQPNVLLVARNPETWRCVFTQASPTAISALQIFAEARSISGAALPAELMDECTKLRSQFVLLFKDK